MSTDDKKQKTESGLSAEEMERLNRVSYVLGMEAIKRISSQKVLIVGLKGLGVEVAKNVILSNVKSVSILDNELVQIGDLSAQFFLTEKDVGKVSRAAASVVQLQELNRFVEVNVVTEELSEEIIKKYTIVVLTNNRSISTLKKITDTCHKNGVHVIASDVRGVFGWIFCDFGESFVVTDVTGEEPLSSLVSSVGSEKEPQVITLDESRHGLEDGDYVQFAEVKGMTQINELQEPVRIKVTGPFTFKLELDTTGFSAYQSGGRVTQVKMPKTVQFKSLSESLTAPDFLFSDFAKFEHPQQWHLLLEALLVFQERHQGQLPPSHHKEAADEVIAIVKEINDKLPAGSPVKVEQVNEAIVRPLIETAAGEISPMSAVFGGLIAQEVLKAASGKFNPIYQWLYMDAVEALPKAPEGAAVSADEYQPLGSRYDDQIAVFGRTFQEKINNLRYFLVGAGAIGCEMLKNWAMMGLSSGPNGRIFVTDMDTIEMSNLSRQFLFRNPDIGKFKSKSAADAVTRMNPQLKIEAYTAKCGPETEEFYDDVFFKNLSGVANALDNVQARLYVDQRCVQTGRSLLESGTLGAKGNVQVVVPFLTAHYGADRDPAEKDFPSCTIKSFPYMVQHTIQWARELFEGEYNKMAEDCNTFLDRDDFWATLPKRGNEALQLDLVQTVEKAVKERPTTFEQCVEIARMRFEELFYNNLAQLTFLYPREHQTDKGMPFWSPPKRFPTALKFDARDPLHTAFVYAAAHLVAATYGLPVSKNQDDENYVAKVASQVNVPPFTPKSGINVNTDESKKEEDVGSVNIDDDKRKIEEVHERLQDKRKPECRMVPLSFEKDDDTNHHIDFIYAAAMLRARNYEITEVDRHQTKQIAGKIIPAIVTTTALVTGLVCIELYKLIQEGKALDQFKNAFVNLALPFISFSEPAPPKSHRWIESKADKTLTVWDQFVVDEGRDLTVREFMEVLRKSHSIEVGMISAGNVLVYNPYAKSAKENIDRKISEVYQTAMKLTLAPNVNRILLEITAEDVETEEDVNTPTLHYVFRK